MTPAAQVLCSLVSLLVGVHSTTGLECGGASSSCDSVDGDESALLQMQSRQAQGLQQDTSGHCFDVDPTCTKSYCFDPLQVYGMLCQKTCGVCVVTTTPLPAPVCDYDDGACYAQKESCDLYSLLRTQTWHNQNITLVVNELKEICLGNWNSTGPMRTQKNRNTRKAMESCKGDDNPCAIDVKEYLDDNPGAEYLMDGASVIASTVLEAIGTIYEELKWIGVGGQIAFALLGNILGSFFPSAGDLPANPCTYAGDDWAKCVWEQIQPLVSQFVDQKIDGLFTELWKANIQGYQYRMSLIQGQADFDSDHFPNGTISNMSQTVFDTMMKSLYSMHESMTSDAPLFAADHNSNSVAGVYLPMFATLHFSVMSNIWSSRTYRTPGFRFIIQKSTICYARKMVSRVVDAVGPRLKSMTDGAVATSAKCPGYPSGSMYNTECPYTKYNFQDNFTGCNFWTLKCDDEIACKPPAPPSLSPTCDAKKKDCKTSEEGQTYDCHRKNVIEQSENLWQTWLSPVPDMLRSVKKIQLFDVQKPQAVAGNLGRFEDTCF